LEDKITADGAAVLALTALAGDGGRGLTQAGFEPLK
jgi:hypothetical protein